MMAERTGWEHYELEKELSNANVFEILEIYKREHIKASDKAIESIKSRLTPEGKEEVEKEFNLLDEGCQKIATHLAKILAGIK
jgi:hypothetical protein